MALDWISRLFSSGSAKGLSGDDDSAKLDPAHYFGSRLRRHRTTGDLIEDPFLLWQTESQRGLRAHLTAQKNQGSADFSDILIIVNADDWTRSGGAEWAEKAARVLTQELTRFHEEVGFEPLHAERGVPFQILSDGGPEMVGEDYALEAGEFITGVVPNTYASPSASSRPVIAVHVNLPDVWEGYQEVGRLFNDQAVFTLGNHWLDNFSHFALQEPALYRLQQYQDGSFVHIIDPDLQNRYSVTSDEAAGANVLSIVDNNAEPICHLVLALLDEEKPSPSDPRPQIELPQMPELSAGDSLEGMGHKTIIPETLQERLLTLREHGALLQKVHFRKFMEGYDVYVSPNGNLSTECVDRAVTFQVRQDKVSLIVHHEKVRVDGSAVAIEVPHPLVDHTSIQVGPHTLVYNDLSRWSDEPGWPYLGEILRPPSRTHLIFGGKYRVGRDRRCKVQLPDEPQNENIAWLASTAGGSTIRARSGNIPKSRFYTDSIMVASEHAEIDLTGDPVVSCIARHCYAFVRRNESVTALYPTRQDGERKTDLKPGDELLIGNCLFRAEFSGDAAESAPPLSKWTAEDLAGAIDTTGAHKRPSPPLSTPEALPAPVQKPEPMQEPAPVQESKPAQPKPRPPRDSLGTGTESKRSASLIDQILNTPRPSPDSERQSDIEELLEERSEPFEVTSDHLDVLLGIKASPPAPDDDVDVPSAAGLGESGSAPRIYDPGPLGADSLMDSGLPLDSTLDAPGPVQAIADPDTGAIYGLPGPSDRKEADKTPFDVFGGPVDAENKPTDVLPRTPEPEHDSSPDSTKVRIVDDEQVQFELGRPARLVQIGWALRGEALVGNHLNSDIVVPELRYERDQDFPQQDYFHLKVRGARTKCERLEEDEARMHQEDQEVSSVKGLDGVRLEVIRRDEDGDEDFSVFLSMDQDFALPDPRGRLLRIDRSDAVVLGLFANGLPLGAEHPIRLGPIQATASFDGSQMRLSNYLESYRTSEGRYQPFFVQLKDQDFVTAPEDGRELALNAGDRLLAGNCVYVFELR